MRDGFKSLLSIFLALLFVSFGAALLCLETQSLTKAKASVNWSSTDGIVSHTGYERTSLGRRTSNAPYVTYSYQVQGRSYSSNVRAFGDHTTDSEIFEQYPSGRSVIVHYDPEHPEDSTLVKGVGTGTIAGLRHAKVVLGLALAVLANFTIAGLKKLGSSRHAGTSGGGKPPN